MQQVMQQQRQGNDKNRNKDVSESLSILLEILTCEPIVQECLQIIENMCLSGFIGNLDFCISSPSSTSTTTPAAAAAATTDTGKSSASLTNASLTKPTENQNSAADKQITPTMILSDPTPAFAAFITKYYHPFLRDAIRMAHGLGFVAWRVRTLRSGDMVPEALPLGTFTWTVETGAEYVNRMMRPRMPGGGGCGNNINGNAGKKNTAEDDTLLRYRISMSRGVGSSRGMAIDPDRDVMVFVWKQPTFNVHESSLLHATVHSPLSHLVEEYKILRETRKRIHNADAWNSTARIVVSSEPKQFNHDASQKEIFETLDFLKGSIEQKRRDTFSDVERVFYDCPSSHRGNIVYELPAHHHIEQVPVLRPICDVHEANAKYASSVCSLMGVPSSLITSSSSRGGGSSGGGSGSAVGGGGGGGGSSAVMSCVDRLFHGRVVTFCIFLSSLLEDVYASIYHGEVATFHIAPMPRLDVQGLSDLKVLHDIGGIQPHQAAKIGSHVLLAAGDHSTGNGGSSSSKRARKKALDSGAGGDSGNGGGHHHYHGSSSSSSK